MLQNGGSGELPGPRAPRPIFGTKLFAGESNVTFAER